jgi:hypothetical protein
MAATSSSRHRAKKTITTSLSITHIPPQMAPRPPAATVSRYGKALPIAPSVCLSRPAFPAAALQKFRNGDAKRPLDRP